ncbi:outer membrane beta-barrel protein [Olleya sp. HaHaR_3_96]|uniref:outer membrane beta-barrel protein n=1 Tax=Olleya sp. HaHaR_3_96 TaxID=2745560 RepID=UPI001C4FFC8D|nr:OmpW family outer membrane protein [Olleya sp. HaHaR_3_96]QXP59126.1 porin family protein [Olleya sp. HaHaR_3_96]
MKKLLFTAAIAVLGFTSVNAQDEMTTVGGFEEGDVFVSGTVGFGSTSVADVDASSFSFSPSVGYFISDNIALELGLTVGSNKGYDFDGDLDFSEDKSSSFGANLGANYFFTPDSQFSFTVGAAFAYQSDKFSPDGGEDASINTFGLAVSPGISYFVSDNFSLRASFGALSYDNAKGDWDDAEAVDTFGLNLDLSDIKFGVAYKFN